MGVRLAQERACLRFTFLVFVSCHRTEQIKQIADLPIGEDEPAIDAHRSAVIVSVLELRGRTGVDHLLQEAEQFQGERVEHARRVGERKFFAV